VDEGRFMVCFKVVSWLWTQIQSIGFVGLLSSGLERKS
jgi:hypothetical protein